MRVFLVLSQAKTKNLSLIFTQLRSTFYAVATFVIINWIPWLVRRFDLWQLVLKYVIDAQWQFSHFAIVLKVPMRAMPMKCKRHLTQTNRIINQTTHVPRSCRHIHCCVHSLIDSIVQTNRMLLAFDQFNRIEYAVNLNSSEPWFDRFSICIRIHSIAFAPQTMQCDD